MKLENLKFDDKGLLPAIVQDVSTKDVLMMAYVNKESLQKTLETGNTWFFSRSRQKLWKKGETSGNIQLVKEIKYDCDNDTLLILVEPAGPACHTGETTCFHRNIVGDASSEVGPSPVEPPEEIEELKSATVRDRPCEVGLSQNILTQLYALIAQRKKEMPKGSYTTTLFKEGLGRIASKISEESTEVIEAAFEKDKKEIIWEAADLIYHLLVLLAAKDVDFKEVEAELGRRRK
jgi:phosphoribosyl-ATP pyrophosphohydrolase/phosphoribosyl-AMP cyclohydrolase